MKEFRISLENLHFYAFHGVLPQERTVGNEFIVTAAVTISAETFSAEADDLDSTISYADLFEIIKEEMDTPRRLLESVAVSIAERFKSGWKNIQSGQIKIVKTAPPIPDCQGSSAVEYFF